MPEARLAKTRATLPEGYQFGDANNERVGCWFEGDTVRVRIPKHFHVRPDSALTSHTQSSDDIE